MSSRMNSRRNKTRTIEDALSKLSDEKLLGDFDDIYELMPVTEDTSCGIGFIRGHTLQKFANKKVLVIVYGVLSLVFASAGAYFNGTITTMEKRYKIPSKNMGIISIGNDVSSLFLSAFIAYYGGKSHRPRLIGIGLFAIVIYCIINASPHLIYGAGMEALSLTVEHGGKVDDGRSEEAFAEENQKLLCRTNSTDGVTACEADDGGSWMPQILLFVAQLIAGIGQTLCSTLGFSYMDDNIKKSKTPALMSISFFMRLLGPAAGYALASVCLKMYISPELTPVINNKDPRWLGAWWMGWLIFAMILFMFSITTIMFPKELPRSAVRRRIEQEKIKRGLKNIDPRSDSTEDKKASLSDMIVTYKRLLYNRVFMLMNIGSILHLFGFLPYWIYTPKIIEIIYHQTASASSFYTGTLAIVFSGIGVLLGGIFISKYKPSARFLAMWHVICGAFCVIGMISYTFMGCEESKKTLSLNHDPNPVCNAECNCDFVRYSPVCGADGLTYISACHAGCLKVTKFNSSKSFNQCSCVESEKKERSTTFSWSLKEAPKASPGPCKVNCQKELFMFLAVMCFLKFIGATGRTSNFLMSMRCVDERDKSAAIGLGSTLIHLFAFIPSPILFGFLLDKACIFWGKTCSGTGNCWLYDGEMLRYLLNFTAALFVAIGTIVDIGVWYYVEDLKIFDDDDEIPSELQSDKKNKKIELVTRY